MNRTVWSATCAVLVCLALSGACGVKAPAGPEKDSLADGTPRKGLVCHQAQQSPTVDGWLDDWQGADSLLLDDTSAVADPNRVKIFTLWDRNYLYVGYEVQDHYLVGLQSERDHKALYKDDMIEVLIDPRRDCTDKWLEDDIVYHVNVLGQVKDDRGTPEGASDAAWQSQGQWAVGHEGTLNDSTDLDQGFSVELAIPWKEIGVTPRPGATVGINFAAGDAEGPEEHLWDWCGAHPFRQPAVYGVLRLE
ncbi:carbohydrate-binding family 9-like protein [bacterium]|nr:carbohydrate-binding family 9-like protein [bacterium]